MLGSRRRTPPAHLDDRLHRLLQRVQQCLLRLQVIQADDGLRRVRARLHSCLDSAVHFPLGKCVKAADPCRWVPGDLRNVRQGDQEAVGAQGSPLMMPPPAPPSGRQTVTAAEPHTCCVALLRQVHRQPCICRVA